MKIKSIHLDKYKRFTDLTIKNIPSTAKLIVLVGPNGCGKSSLFDSFKTWHLINGFNNGTDDHYCKKFLEDKRNSWDLVRIAFHESISSYSKEKIRQAFYFRTAYRNSPKIDVYALQAIESPLRNVDTRMMIQNDATVDENYQRLMSVTISEFYDKKNDDKTVCSLRDELISKVREPLHRLFPDLLLTELGLVTDGANFYFEKGIIKKYGYEKLSGGEKAAFDLLLDFVVKNQYFKDTIFCIDEPETHIHTSLQSRLLVELFGLVPDNSQLWIATHSFGMMKEAKRLSESHPGEVVFLNFDGHDFDEPVTITPSTCDSVLWNKMLEITLDDYADFVGPETVVLCEGSPTGNDRKQFDSVCYNTIFGNNHPSTLFYSIGGCNDVIKDTQKMLFIRTLSPKTNVIRVIDRDDRSDEEIERLNGDNIKVLSRRNIESYLLDDEVLTKWCITAGQPDKTPDLLQIKTEALTNSKNRGRAPDDLKSASCEICDKGKRLLGLTRCGNDADAIMRDTLAKLITSDMTVYQELEKDIFS
ncbi:MAG: AAA family ATPase [Lentisphaeria bacterium]|nr:AAA family ATPase [Lentisphaeria bacterium]